MSEINLSTISENSYDILNVATDGNVGLNTTTPSYSFDVKGDVVIGTNHSYGSIVVGNNINSTLQIYNVTSGSVSKFFNENGSNIIYNDSTNGGHLHIASNRGSGASGLFYFTNDLFSIFAGRTDVTSTGGSFLRIYNTLSIGHVSDDYDLINKNTLLIRASGHGGLILDNLTPNDSYFKTSIGSSLETRALQMNVADDGSVQFYTKVGENFYKGTLATSSYFTGQHMCVSDTLTTSDVKNLYGLIVSSQGEYANIDVKTGQMIQGKDAISINESLPKIQLSSSYKDKKVYGVITSHPNIGNIKNSNGIAYDYEDYDFKRNLYGRLRINSLGEGGIWVCNEHGNIENGDYITSSNIPGYGTRQDDYKLHNFTVAKATCNINFDDVNLESKFLLRYINENGNEVDVSIAQYKAVFIGCTYHCA